MLFDTAFVIKLPCATGTEQAAVPSKLLLLHFEITKGNGSENHNSSLLLMILKPYQRGAPENISARMCHRRLQQAR